jgi:replicative DNA helicase
LNDKRIPPHNREAEQSVLGSMLIDAASVALAVEALSPDSFYNPSHKEIFEAMCFLHENGKPIDLVTITDELDRRKTISKVGGIEYLTELSMFVPATSNVSHYIAIVEERATLRRLIQAGSQIAKESFESELALEEIIDKAEKRIFDICMRKQGESLLHIKEALSEGFLAINAAVKNKGGITGTPTGFNELDKLTSGLHETELVIVAGRPSSGKTSFAMNIVQNAALKHNIPAAVFSLEMPARQLGIRMMCSDASVDMEKVKSGNLSLDEIQRLAQSMGRLSLAPIYVDDTRSISPLEIRSRCRRLKIEKGLGLVVVDYLQLMEGSARAENRLQAVSQMTRQFKNMAFDLECPIILLSQLSRESEKQGRRPRLSDLRESGSIEQDADIVMFVHREALAENEEDKGKAEIILAKQRNGPTDIIRLAWQGEYTRFLDAAF